ncbi:MAG: hypothetical protein WCG78_01190 [Candidatus Omnitrophota bacterium]
MTNRKIKITAVVLVALAVPVLSVRYRSMFTGERSIGHELVTADGALRPLSVFERNPFLCRRTVTGGADATLDRARPLEIELDLAKRTVGFSDIDDAENKMTPTLILELVALKNQHGLTYTPMTKTAVENFFREAGWFPATRALESWWALMDEYRSAQDAIGEAFALEGTGEADRALPVWQKAAVCAQRVVLLTRARLGRELTAQEQKCLTQMQLELADGHYEKAIAVHFLNFIHLGHTPPGFSLTVNMFAERAQERVIDDAYGIGAGVLKVLETAADPSRAREELERMGLKPYLKAAKIDLDDIMKQRAVKEWVSGVQTNVTQTASLKNDTRVIPYRGPIRVRLVDSDDPAYGSAELIIAKVDDLPEPLRVRREATTLQGSRAFKFNKDVAYVIIQPSVFCGDWTRLAEPVNGFKALHNKKAVLLGKYHQGRFRFGAAVSKEHVIISRDGDSITIKDVGSRNKTGVFEVRTPLSDLNDVRRPADQI